MAGKDITVRDTADVLAGNKGAAAEAVKLDAVNGAISVDGTVVATADDVKLEAKGAVLVSDKAATAPLAGDTVNGFIQALAGDVTVESEAADVTVQDHSKVLAGVNDDATYTVATAGKTVTLNASQTSGTGSISVKDDAVVIGSKDATAKAKGSVGVLGNAQVLAKAGDASLTADTGAVSIDGVVEAGNDVSVVATAGDVTVEDNVAGADTTKGLVKADAGKVTISADAAGTVGSVTVKEDAKVEAAQNVSVVAGKDITVRDMADVLAGNKGAAAEAVKLDAVNGAISVDGTVVATADDVGLNAGASITVKDNNGTDDAQEGLVQAQGGQVIAIAGSNILIDQDAAVDASTAVSLTANGNDGGVTPTAIKITGTADATAGTEVNINSTAAGDVMIDTTANVTANDGSVTIANANGAVTIQNATVEAKKGATATAANVDIDATGDVSVTDGATVKADDNVLVDTAGGSIYVKNATVTAGNNMHIAAAGVGDDVVVDTGVTMTAGQHATITAGKDVNINSDVTATAGDAYVQAEGGDVNMDAGTTVKASGTAFVGAAGDLMLSQVQADTVWLKTGGSIENTTVNGGGVTANNLLLDADGHVGAEGDKIQVDVDTIAARAGNGGVYVHEVNSVTVGSVDAAVEKVLSDGSLATPKFSGGQVGISATGEVALDADGELTFDEAVSGSSIAIESGGSLKVNTTISGIDTVELTVGGDVTLGKDSKVKGGDVVVTAGGDITQEGDVSVPVNNGNVSKSPEIHAAIEADSTATLVSTGGSIGGAKSGTSTYVGVKTGSGADDGVAASAENGSIAIAAGDSTDLVLANTGGADDKGGISAKGRVAVYTSKTIRPNSATIKGSSITVTAQDFTGGNVKINLGGGELTVNNEKFGQTLLAIFETAGGNSNVRVNNQPNKAVVFVDGRLAGGDIQTINKLGAMEAFPVQTPELKSEQGIFGNPVFLHDELGVANPIAVGAIDFLLLDIPRLTLSSDFPLEIEKQVAAAGLNPTTSYWFGQKSNDEVKDEAEGNGDGKDGEGKPSAPKGNGGDAPAPGNQTAMN